MFTTDTLTTIRALGLAAAGLISAAYAGLTLWSPDARLLPDWLPLAAGILSALVIFLSFALGGRRNALAATDERYFAENARAATYGFWGALIIGTTLWLTGAGGAMQLAITLTGSAALYLLAQVVFEIRGRGWL